MFSSRSSESPRGEFDYLIVGLGLAGAVLAQLLRAKGQQVCVIDPSTDNSASEIAAGIINPVTGHRLNITEGFGNYFSYAKQFYQNLEQQVGRPIFTPVKQVRLIKNKGQYEYYLKRRNNPEYQNIFGRYQAAGEHFKDAPFGELEIRQCAIVSTQNLLQVTRKQLQQDGALHDAAFDHSLLQANANQFAYQGIESSTVIFCEGHAATRNPWLQHLPFKLSKGEIVNLQGPPLTVPFLNWGQWGISDPVNDAVRLGSTYEWADLSLSANKTQDLVESMRRNVGVDHAVTSTDVGIRPTTKHRQPFIGEISGLPGSYCFNGFGSKGCLLIPYYAKLLTAAMLAGQPLPEEVSRWL